MKRVKLKIEGMHCESCAELIKDKLESMGVKAEIDYKTGKAKIEFDESKTNIEKIKETISKVGYSVV